jgi:hypothetical protein
MRPLPTKKREAPVSLMDETELLIIDLVKDAKKERVLEDGSTQKLDILDRVRAADAALRFMAMKDKIGPKEEEESAFERSLKDLHGEPDNERGGSAADTKGKGPGGFSHTSH